MTTTLVTARLRLRPLTLDDADFIVELLNEPDFVRFIGDRQVRSREDAQRYLREGPLRAYERHGFGLGVVESLATGESLGMCGLLKRDTLDDVDLGFAFLARHRRRGYAFESARAALDHGRATLGLTRVVAITLPDNVASIGLLARLGMRYERRLRLTPEGEELELWASDTA